MDVFVNPKAPIAVSRYGEAVFECRNRADSKTTSLDRRQQPSFPSLDTSRKVSGLQPTCAMFPNGLPGVENTRSVTVLRAMDMQNSVPNPSLADYDSSPSPPSFRKYSKASANTWSSSAVKLSGFQGYKSKIPTKIPTPKRPTIPNFATPTMASTMREHRGSLRSHFRPDAGETTKVNPSLRSGNARASYSTATVIKKPHAPLLMTQLRAAKHRQAQEKAGSKSQENKGTLTAVLPHVQLALSSIGSSSTQNRTGEKKAKVSLTNRPLPPPQSSGPNIDVDHGLSSMSGLTFGNWQTDHRRTSTVRLVTPSNLSITEALPRQEIQVFNVIDTVTEPAVIANNFFETLIWSTTPVSTETVSETHGTSALGPYTDNDQVNSCLGSQAQDMLGEAIEDDWELLLLSDDETAVGSEDNSDSSGILIITERAETLTSRNLTMVPHVEEIPTRGQETPIPEIAAREIVPESSPLRPEATAFVPVCQPPVLGEAPGTHLKEMETCPHYFEEQMPDFIHTEGPVRVPGTIQPYHNNEISAPWAVEHWMHNLSGHGHVPTGPLHPDRLFPRNMYNKSPLITYGTNHIMDLPAFDLRDTQIDDYDTAISLLTGNWAIDTSQKWWEPPVPMGFRARAAFNQPGRKQSDTHGRAQ